MGLFLSKTKENNKNYIKQTFSIVLCISYTTIKSKYDLKSLIELFFRQNKILKHNQELSKWNSSDYLSMKYSSAKEIISFQVIEEKRPQVSNLVEKLNSFLNKNNAANIKVWSIISIPKPFLPNKHCDSKQYGYLFPNSFFNFDSFLLLFHSLSPYLDKNINLNLNMSISNNFDSYFIVYLKGSKLLSHNIALAFFTIYSNIAMSKGNISLHDFTLSIMENHFDECMQKLHSLLPIEGLFFDYDDHPRFTMRARRPLLPPDKDVDFFSLKPFIEEWKYKTLFPKIEKQTIPLLQGDK